MEQSGTLLRYFQKSLQVQSWTIPANSTRHASLFQNFHLIKTPFSSVAEVDFRVGLPVVTAHREIPPSVKESH